ncbi:MAG TPA: aminopeptidase P family N-terminal domain-containing protein [Candidatus Limnocylindrales bacterium]|nr:aminopeptidase P family N-terminal domain-containing protein [Candidatus Limnocylindrales bacterium]
MQDTPLTEYQNQLREAGVQAVVLESGPIMLALTGVRWGKSERTFAAIIPAKGDPAWVLPGFEEMRARELIKPANADIRVWQEDESPYALIVKALKDRGVTTGKVGIDENARFFVFDGIRKLAPGLTYIPAPAV